MVVCEINLQDNGASKAKKKKRPMKDMSVRQKAHGVIKIMHAALVLLPDQPAFHRMLRVKECVILLHFWRKIIRGRIL